MILRHVALACSSEEKADQFYRDLLGLTKSEPKILSRSLSHAFFNIDSELTVINYQNDMARFEIFVHDYPIRGEKDADHTCIQVADKDSFLENCREARLRIMHAPKGDKVITFIRDFDGNLFEVI